MKLVIAPKKVAEDTVAPRRGAWIETQKQPEFPSVTFVAPRRGAWIETLSFTIYTVPMFWSHPAGVRGLKQIPACCGMFWVLRRTPQGCVD